MTMLKAGTEKVASDCQIDLQGRDSELPQARAPLEAHDGL